MSHTININFVQMNHPSAENPPFTGKISAQTHQILFEASKTHWLGVIPSALEVLISSVEMCVGFILAGITKSLQRLNLFSEETNKKFREIEFGGMFHGSLAFISIFIHILNIGTFTHFNNQTASPFYQFTNSLSAESELKAQGWTRDSSGNYVQIIT
jgi:hypothetical protein